MLLLISDASILIAMHNGGLLEKMFKSPFRFATPDVMFVEELQEQYPFLPELGLETPSMSGELVERVEQLIPKYSALRPNPPRRLDIFALVLAQHEQCILLTGDMGLRRAAESEGIEVHGIIWLVEHMLTEGIISIQQAETAFSRMREEGDYLPWDLTSELVKERMKEKDRAITVTLDDL